MKRARSNSSPDIRSTRSTRGNATANTVTEILRNRRSDRAVNLSQAASKDHEEVTTPKTSQRRSRIRSNELVTSNSRLRSRVTNQHKLILLKQVRWCPWSRGLQDMNQYQCRENHRFEAPLIRRDLCLLCQKLEQGL